MSSTGVRDAVVSRLIKDLVGPFSEDEVLLDRPTQRYSTGILYPRDSRVETEEDEDGGLAANISEDVASSPDVSGVSLHATLKPSTAGISFATRPTVEGTNPGMEVEVRYATYERIAVDDAGEEIEGEPKDRAHERWRRNPRQISVSVEICPGETRVDLTEHGARDLELYVLVTPHAGLFTVTAALSNRRNRGDSRIFDETQHFFQVELLVRDISNGEFAPRPSRRAELDEDSRIAALIYRDVAEYVVGHTCSARAMLGPDNEVRVLKSEWIPTAEVPGISDQGDEVFDGLRQDAELQPLQADWISQAPVTDLTNGLQLLVRAYQTWITQETQKVEHLPDSLQPQAQKNLERCTQGADRMIESISLIRDDAIVRKAFQLAQEAMHLQYAWTSDGESLVWRPFQLAFQLLVLSSLANRSHQDRETMDLLWFPTGGGKTEAYLALTGFAIMLRRLRASKDDDGTGVAVLMRYTLRLLTIQQFQRAAALICACELLRRRTQNGDGGIPRLGDSPIGIGLWVGAAATPLTLREALSLSPGDSSSPIQLTSCPSCQSTLCWRITPQESIVECPSMDEECVFAASGSRLPIWTIDEEIYRKVPSLVIGTVDKFAQIVRKNETRALFGMGRNNAPPDLIIQDELHLISGPLGSIAGLYEVAIDEFCRKGDKRSKVIGSTATIRRATEQARALFDRKTYQFPPPGLDATNSGFAVVDTQQPGRLYLGVTTAGRSATYMLQALTASLLQAATQSGGSGHERDYYWTLVVYFNSLRELGRALVLMQDDVPISIGQFAGRHGEAPRSIDPPAELTSRVPSYEIRDMLDRLNRGKGDAEAVDLLLASNMISVGMDIPRLGMMVVNAQPKSLAEYIQATSRVGRGEVPGLIVTMYNNSRARDRSHYETFETWHRSLYRDVEATSVTPFASRAQDKALHAVLVALVRHLVPGMDSNPVLNDHRRVEAERLAAVIVQRVNRVDPTEGPQVSQKLMHLLDEWASRPDLQRYWDDYGRRTSLLMSAEQFAARGNSDPDLDSEGTHRSLWPTLNSMREVEAGTPFVLRTVLRVRDNQDA